MATQDNFGILYVGNRVIGDDTLNCCDTYHSAHRLVKQMAYQHGTQAGIQNDAFVHNRKQNFSMKHEATLETTL